MNVICKNCGATKDKHFHENNKVYCLINAMIFESSGLITVPIEFVEAVRDFIEVADVSVKRLKRFDDRAEYTATRIELLCELDQIDGKEKTE